MKKELKLTSENELYRELRTNSVRPCYFFYGKDVATLESVVRKLIAKLVPDDARDFNYHFFPGDDLDLSQLADVCESLPVFAERIVAAVNDLNAENLRTADQKFLNSILTDLDGSTATVIFYSTGVDLCAGKKTLSPKNFAFAEKITEVGGAVVEFAYKRPAELVKYIQSRVEKRGSTIGQNAAQRLAEACLCNLLMINNEIEKLTAFRFGNEISEEDVSLLVAGQLDADAYKLAKAVASGDKKSVFRILPELYNRQQESLSLLSVIGVAFTDLYRAKLALMSNHSQNDVVSDFDYRSRAFAVRDAARDCVKIPVERLRYCLGVLSDCDIDMKSKRTDNRVLLETAITRMMNSTE